jgi:hypothetical protein
MSGWLPPALVLMVALAATYLCCVRPMRSGRCHCTPAETPTADDGLERQLRHARAERSRLRTR